MIYKIFGMNHGYLRLKLSVVVDWDAILAHSQTVHSQAISQGYIIHSTRYRWANFENVYLYLARGADALQSIKRGQ